MRSPLFTIFLVALVTTAFAPLQAQETPVTGDQDGSSQGVEESDEAYRRRMELEDARRRDPNYTDPPNDYRRDMEKIDKLPQESRENIRDQLIDIIVDNPEWQPGDALKDYPYEPSEAARSDPELAQQEQEAWDEQIEKYHAREAAAYGAYRGPVSGPGNPDGAEGSQEGGGEQGGQDGGDGQGDGQGQDGQQGAAGSSGASGTYEPYSPTHSNPAEEISTRGVSESALDFLRQRMPPQTGDSPAPETPSDAAQPQAETAETPEETSERGILAIEDLEKLEGTGNGAGTKPPEEPEDPPEEPRSPDNG